MCTVPSHCLHFLPLITILCISGILVSTQPADCNLGPYASEFSSAPLSSRFGPNEQQWIPPLPSFLGPGTVGLILQRATVNRLINGGVVVIGDRSGILAVTSRGRLDGTPGAPPLDEHTMFDLASLTKVVATAPAVMKLLDQGRISLSAPISRWLPEFRNSRHTINVLDLLPHTSGLADLRLRPHQTIHGIALRAAEKQVARAPGGQFHYADINFILLAELVHRVSGKPLDVFCQDEIYGPLGMGSTMFRPPREVFGKLAPSTDFAKGKPQDRNARRLGGVAGHAGLFSSAADLSRYARLMMGHGSLEGNRIFSEEAIAQMTAAHPCSGGRIERGLGWDIESPYSAPKGALFSEKSFGHTGYSGSSIWIDPESDIFVIILTNRRNFSDTTSFNQFRRDVSTVAAAQFGKREADTSWIYPQRVQDEVSKMTSRCLVPFKEQKAVVAKQRDRIRGTVRSRATHGRRNGNPVDVQRHGKIASSGHDGHRKRHRNNHGV